MRANVKYISIVVMTTLVGVIAYQASWLTQLYRQQKDLIERQYRNMLIWSDNQEISERIHALMPEEGVDVKLSLNLFTEETDCNPEQDGQNVIEDPYATTATSLMQMLHASVDSLMPPDVHKVDSVFARLTEKEQLHFDYQITYLNQGKEAGTAASAGYRPDSSDSVIDYWLDDTKQREYRLTLAVSPAGVMRHMAGILAASLLLLAVIGLGMWYLIHLLRKMRTLDQLKTDFTNNMTHELKTPISVAYSAIDSLLNFDMSDDPQLARKYLQIGQEQLSVLAGLTEQILTMSRHPAKYADLEMQQVPLLPLLQTLIEQHKLKAKKDVQFHLDVNPDNLCVTADKHQLFRILGNLIDNAIKYSRPAVSIDITARKNRISVSDNGNGISPDDLPHLFEKFYRSKHQKGVKGFGLGLYFVRTMMERMGGSVAVDTTPGTGSVFTLTFKGECSPPPQNNTTT